MKLAIASPALLASSALAAGGTFPEQAAELLARRGGPSDLASAAVEKPKTILEEEFCQVYYDLKAPLADDVKCEDVRDAVRSEIRGSGTPTLELGDPSEKPVLVFFHGWPDSAAMWSNQFAHFCSEGKDFACVAPSMMNYNPDVEAAAPSMLSWPLQADVLYEVITDMGLKDITLVIHDFGAIVGSMFVGRHPEVVKRVVMLDIANSPGAFAAPKEETFQTLFPFQQNAITAFRTKNDTLMHLNLQFMKQAFGPAAPPCTDCTLSPDTEIGAGSKTGWMHTNWVNEDPAWPSFFSESEDEFEFTYTPSWPDDVPYLFLWGTGQFHAPELLPWLDARGDGSGHARLGMDHWFFLRGNTTLSNEKMADFFAATETAAEKPSTILEEEFCQVYYDLKTPLADEIKCEDVRDAVRSEIRGSGTPTLELGDPSEKPVLVFFHGWPDSAAMWSNQFAHFCSEGKDFACVAPSMMDYNPDVAAAAPSMLSWPLQADVLYEVITDMGLKDITLVIHDFGAIVGSMFVGRHPEVVKRVVMLDIANSPGDFAAPKEETFQTLIPFQQQAITAFRTKNDTLMHLNLLSIKQLVGPAAPPCLDCTLSPDTEIGVGSKTGWMHTNWVNEDPAWPSFFSESEDEFEFTYTPSWPDDVPYLFLWGTGLFHSPELLPWLDARGDGSGHARMGMDHWFFMRGNTTLSNEKMADFFAATEKASTPANPPTPPANPPTPTPPTPPANPPTPPATNRPTNPEPTPAPAPSAGMVVMINSVIVVVVGALLTTAQFLF